MKQYRMPAIAFYSLLFVSAFMLLGCEVGSSDSATRNVGVDFTGFYDSTETNSDFVSPANSGARVTSFNLRQHGDQLEAIDNNGIVFSGSVGDPSGSSGTGTASFQLDGHTTAGQAVTISGTLSGANTEGNSASATMSGTWIEPNLYARILGDAIINAIVTNSPSPTTNSLAILPAGPVSLAEGESKTFTASGGSGTYSSWQRSNTSLGTLSSSSGASTTYARNSYTGTNTLTVTDSDGDTASVTIIQP